MAENSQEIGPIVAGAMILIGLSSVVWAVATKERMPAEKPNISFNATGPGGSIGTPPPPPPEEPPPPADPNEVSEDEWEKVLLDLEKVREQGIVTDTNVSTQIVTVSKEKWDALTDDRKKELGVRLAIYCGRVSGSDKYEAKVQYEDGAEVGAYKR